MNLKNIEPNAEQKLFGNLLDEQILHYRRSDTGERVATTLPELFIAMAQDHVRDFPALRPHQRHPWHAFLVQLAAIALHRSARSEPFGTAPEWRAALLALTPDDPDGAAWCLVSPVSRPAFMQAPEPSGNIDQWERVLTPDELDMLVTSKNHDLKSARMRDGGMDDWIFALISLQTQDGYPGSKNFGIARMNSGSGSRCGVGIFPNGNWGMRWKRDLSILRFTHESVVRNFELQPSNAITLVWLLPWDGRVSIPFNSLDPWFIEICRRIRLSHSSGILAHRKGSEVPRISAKQLKGVTGDPWVPIVKAAGTALTITGYDAKKLSTQGFGYQKLADFLFGSTYEKPSAQKWLSTDDVEGVYLIARGIARGQSKTAGYHERRIPISRKVRQALLTKHTDDLAKLADEHIAAIAEVGKMLLTALAVLFGNGAKDESGKDKGASDAAKDRASAFSQPFEALCDAHFFPELMSEIEADDREAVRNEWLLTLATRAELVLQSAFVAGPRNGQLRYRAQSAALGRLHSMMRGNKLPALANALKFKKSNPLTPSDEETHEHT